MTTNNKKEKVNAPKIDRFAELLETKQETPAFPEPEKVQILTHTIVCFADARSKRNKDAKPLLTHLNSDVYKMLEEHTAGSKNEVINKLIAYAIEDLLKRNISIK